MEYHTALSMNLKLILANEKAKYNENQGIEKHTLLTNRQITTPLLRDAGTSDKTKEKNKEVIPLKPV